ncbi:MAG: formate dehydrogenase accessory protein FdhE [Neisseria sp.]|nr:formate dehydrogenase accessory protein FdhE [Neisseria sp.]
MNTIPVKPVEAIKKGLFHTPFWLAPAQNVFEERAVRFQELAQSDRSEWRVYLELLAVLSNAQHRLWQGRIFALPELYRGNTVLPAAAAAEVPADFVPVLAGLLAEVRGSVGATVQAELDKLTALAPGDAEALAGRVLGGRIEHGDRAAAIWVQAALQVIWTAWAAQLSEDHVPPVEERVNCPCCGTEAVGSLVLIKGDLAGFRYMHCPHCNSRWNALRAKCPSCGDSSGMRIQEIDPEESPDLAPALTAARAESCESCHSYRKLYRLDKQQYADPLADDLASLALDILVGEDGYRRGGANPFLLLGE